jgi:hypothetical protein
VITIAEMRDAGRYGFIMVVFLAANPVWGGANEWQVRPKPAETSLYESRLIPMGDGSPTAPMSMQKLGSDPDRSRTYGLLSSTTWLKGAFSTETEVAANEGDSRAAQPSARMLRLGAIGSAGLVRYGMTYRTADAAYHGEGDAQREAWGELRRGAMAIRSLIGQRTDLKADGGGNRREQSYHRIDVSWNRPAWPVVSFSYAQNAANTTMDPLSLYPQKADHHRLEAAVGYTGARWDAKLASSYGFETDLMRHAAESQVQAQTAAASFHLLESLTVTPTFGYRAEQQKYSSVRIETPSASISMRYNKSPRLSMTATGNYSAMRSSDKLVELDMIGGKGTVSWELEPLRDWKPQLSLEGGYNLQVNRLMPSAQTENLSGLLRLVLATM